MRYTRIIVASGWLRCWGVAAVCLFLFAAPSVRAEIGDPALTGRVFVVDFSSWAGASTGEKLTYAGPKYYAGTWPSGSWVAGQYGNTWGWFWGGDRLKMSATDMSGIICRNWAASGVNDYCSGTAAGTTMVFYASISGGSGEVRGHWEVASPELPFQDPDRWLTWDDINSSWFRNTMWDVNNPSVNQWYEEGGTEWGFHDWMLQGNKFKLKTNGPEPRQITDFKTGQKYWVDSGEKFIEMTPKWLVPPDVPTNTPPIVPPYTNQNPVVPLPAGETIDYSQVLSTISKQVAGQTEQAHNDALIKQNADSVRHEETKGLLSNIDNDLKFLLGLTNLIDFIMGTGSGLSGNVASTNEAAAAEDSYIAAASGVGSNLWGDAASGFTVSNAMVQASGLTNEMRLIFPELTRIHSRQASMTIIPNQELIIDFDWDMLGSSVAYMRGAMLLVMIVGFWFLCVETIQRGL
jgi:hypothetical protein